MNLLIGSNLLKSGYSHIRQLIMSLHIKRKLLNIFIITKRTEGALSLRCLMYIPLIVGSVAMIFPLFWMVSTALKSPSEISAFPPTFFPKIPRPENFIEAWTYRPFSLYFLNSLFVATFTTLLVLTVSTLAGFAFAKYKFFGRNVLFLMILSTLMIPPQITMIPVFLILKRIRLLDTLWGLMMPLSSTGLGTFLMRQYILTIPGGLLDAARLDGCSELGIWWRIILPLVKPALSVLTIFTFMMSWNAFLWPLIVLNSQEKYTLQLGLARFQGAYFFLHHYMMAVSFIAIFPVLIVFIVFQRTFVKGVALTGLK